MNSQLIPCIPENAPFTAEQRAWLNGFLAGIFSKQEMPVPFLSPVQTASPSVMRPLTVLFGSQTGTAEALAKKTSSRLSQMGFAVTVYDMAEYPVGTIGNEKQVLIITSTYGDGEPPDNGKTFWRWLQDENSLDLSTVEFSVLALGDTNYEKFCQFGKEVDREFERRGAKRMFPCVQCDVDYEENYQKWLEGVTGVLRSADAASKTAVVTDRQSETQSSPTDTPVYSRKKPFVSALVDIRRLTAEVSEKDIRHLAFSLEGSGLFYKVGDSLGIVPQNCGDLADEILSLKGLNPNQEVTVGEESLSLRNALVYKFDICKLTPPFLKWISTLTHRDSLSYLLHPENKNELENYLWGRRIVDALYEYSDARFSADELLANLKPLQPRLYSISSSPLAHPGEVHITVAVVRYTFCERRHNGVCSGFLADRIELGDQAPLYINHTKNFFLPDDPSVPIIMVGPGTGIAPFRAFLEERQAMGAPGKNWLIFGNPHRETDFLYRDELENMMNNGVLTRLDTAFSRDQAEKIYVQHRLLEQANEVYGWLQEGAYFYVCGDAKYMAKDVHNTLQAVIEKASGCSPEKAKNYVEELMKSKRYQRDVY